MSFQLGPLTVLGRARYGVLILGGIPQTWGLFAASTQRDKQHMQLMQPLGPGSVLPPKTLFHGSLLSLATR